MESMSRYLGELKGLLGQLPLQQLEEICGLLFRAYEEGRTIFIFGNGGSAALASHMACDLGKGVYGPPRTKGADTAGKFLKVLSLTDNVPMMTAWANDASYDEVFARQMEILIQPGDLAFGISTSGNSPNVLRALELARRKGAVTLGFTGRQGGKMKPLLDYGICVPSDHVQQIEDLHLILMHLVFLDLKRRIGG